MWKKIKPRMIRIDTDACVELKESPAELPEKMVFPFSTCKLSEFDALRATRTSNLLARRDQSLVLASSR